MQAGLLSGEVRDRAIRLVRDRRHTLSRNGRRSRPSVDTSIPATDRYRKSGHHGRGASTGFAEGPARGVGRLVECGPPARRAARDHVGMLRDGVEESGDRGGVAEQRAQVLRGAVGGQDRGRPRVAVPDELQQVLGVVGGSFRIPRSSMIRRGRGCAW
jgi:hypothetical protein